jgi:hypothetical protein
MRLTRNFSLEKPSLVAALVQRFFSCPVILACLEKDPANRPASADALEQTLASLQHEDDWSPERARQWWQMHGLLQPRSLA